MSRTIRGRNSKHIARICDQEERAFQPGRPIRGEPLDELLMDLEVLQNQRVLLPWVEEAGQIDDWLPLKDFDACGKMYSIFLRVYS